MGLRECFIWEGLKQFVSFRFLNKNKEQYLFCWHASLDSTAFFLKPVAHMQRIASAAGWLVLQLVVDRKR